MTLPSPKLSVIEEPMVSPASSSDAHSKLMTSPSQGSRSIPSPPPCSRAGQADQEQGLEINDSSNATSTDTVVESKPQVDHEDQEEAIDFIQAALRAHDLRSRALTKPKIHTARPWLKKKPSLAPSLSLNEVHGGSESTSSEEDMMDRVCRTIQGAIKAHDARKTAMEMLEADKDLFTQGKVSAMKEKFNERRKRSVVERSDGVTDDDDDVVF